MFKFLKSKIKEAVSKFSKKTDVEEEEVDIPVEEVVERETVAELQEQQDESDDKVQEDLEEDIEENIKEDIKSDPEPSLDETLIEDEPLEEPVVELSKPYVEELPIGKPLEEEDQIIEPSSSEEESPESIVEEPEVIELIEPEEPEVPDVIEESQEIPESISELAHDDDISQSKELSQDTKELFEEEASETSPSVVEPEVEVKEELAYESVEETKDESIEVDTEPSEEKSLVEEELSLEEPKEEIIKPSLVVESSEPVEEEPVVEEKKSGFFKRIFGGKKTVEPDTAETETESMIVENIAADDDYKEGIIDEEILEDVVEDNQVDSEVEEKETQERHDLLEEVTDDATKKKKGFFAKIKEKIVKFQLTESVFEEVFWDFELALLENNVALEVIEKVKADMHEQLTKENVSRKSVDEVILDTLKKSLEEVLTVESFDFIAKAKEKKSSGEPLIVSIVGVNGSGKTTTLAKLINLLQKNELSVVVAASDTFRAAAIQQLEEHTNKLGVKLIKHDYNADPSAVAYDAISHAKAKNIDVVLIDTAGRLQSNSNLMDELKKLIRVNKPDLNIFIGESVTGNDCVEQAMAFNEAVGIDGIILSKADIDEKGGAAISVSYVTKKPILYLGTGQTYDDFKLFKKEEILENLGL